MRNYYVDVIYVKKYFEDNPLFHMVICPLWQSNSGIIELFKTFGGLN